MTNIKSSTQLNVRLHNRQPSIVVSQDENSPDVYHVSKVVDVVDKPNSMDKPIDMSEALKVWPLPMDTEIWLMGYDYTPDMQAKLLIFKNFEVVKDNRGNDKIFTKPIKFDKGKQMASNPYGNDIPYILLNGRRLYI